MRTLAAALALLTMLAVAYLSFALLLLRPPRANFPLWFTFAAVVTIQSVATLVAVTARIPWLRIVAAGAGAALAAAGVWLIRGTLTSAHFEGYALILGAMLVAQGIATIAAFAHRTVARPTV
jgi:hypothetical protein